jgi:predicted esterase
VGAYRVEERDFGNFTILHPRNAEHQYTLIWLHGIGTDGQSFKNLFLDDRQMQLPYGCKVIIPTAPMRKVTSCERNMYAWYDYRTFDMPQDNKITPELLEKNFSQF